MTTAIIVFVVLAGFIGMPWVLDSQWFGVAQRRQTFVAQGVAFPLAVRGRADGADLEMGEEGTYNALRAGDGGSSRANLVAYRRSTTMHDDEDPDRWEESELSGTQLSHSTTQRVAIVDPAMTVRRLTPTECERLQGFPDGFTAGQTDSARYRQIGNAVTVPVIAWIGRRFVAKALSEREATS